MKKFGLLMLLTLPVMQAGLVQAADLDGAWTSDPAYCAQVFMKKGNELAFKPDADLHAGGLIVQGRKITGTFQKCTVKSLHDDGANRKVIASCSDGVAFSDMAFDLQISGENTITLRQKEPVPVEVSYVRCAL